MYYTKNEPTRDKKQLLRDPFHLRKQKKYFVIYILIHGMHATHECLKPLKNEIMKLGTEDTSFIIHLAKNREGNTHKSINWQTQNVKEETEQLLSKNEKVLNAIMEGRQLILVYIGHSLGGVVLDKIELSYDFKKINRIAEVMFVMITAPLKGLDGNPAKMLELKETLLAAFTLELCYYPFGNKLISSLKEALEVNLDPRELPINSQSPSLKEISRAARGGKSTPPTSPTLCIAAQCPGLFLLSGLGNDLISGFVLERLINSLTLETKQKINLLWIEMLDGEENHDGVVPTDSQSYYSSNLNVKLLKLEGVSHKSVLHDSNVPKYIYDYVIDELSKLRLANL
jgi:hypothetical protein